MVGELADSTEFVVVNANDRRCLCVLMVSPKSLQACEKQSINDWSSSWVWVATAASSANSMPLMISLRTFVSALRRARLKSLSSERVRKVLLLLCLRHVLATGQRKSQRALEQGRSLV